MDRILRELKRVANLITAAVPKWHKKDPMEGTYVIKQNNRNIDEFDMYNMKWALGTISKGIKDSMESGKDSVFQVVDPEGKTIVEVTVNLK
jgi:hypothetical protein